MIDGQFFPKIIQRILQISGLEELHGIVLQNPVHVEAVIILVHIFSSRRIGRRAVLHAVRVGPDKINEVVFQKTPDSFFDPVIIFLFDAVDIDLYEDPFGVQLAGRFQVKVVIAFCVGQDGNEPCLLQTA